MPFFISVLYSIFPLDKFFMVDYFFDTNSIKIVHHHILPQISDPFFGFFMNENKPAESSEVKIKLKPAIKSKLEPVVLQIFSQDDFHQVNMREIAKRAGVGYATIYRHFKSKEQLLFWFVDLWLSDLIERIIDHLRGMAEIKEKVRKIVWVQLDFYNRNPNVGRIIFMTLPLTTWMKDKTYKQERMAKLMLEVFGEGQEKQILDPKLPVSALLDVLFGMLRRIFTMWIYREQKGELIDQSNLLFELVWRAIVNPNNR